MKQVYFIDGALAVVLGKGPGRRFGRYIPRTRGETVLGNFDGE